MIKYFSKYKSNIIILFFAMFLVYSMNISLNLDLWLLNSFKGNDIFCIIQLILYIVLLKEVIKIKDKRLTKIALIISVLFSLFEVIGYTINNYDEFFSTIFSNHYFIKLIIKFIGYIVIFYSIILIIYSFVTKYLAKRNMELPDNVDLVKDEKALKNKKRKMFLLFWIIILISYVPYFLQYYPGILSFDSASEIGEATGVQQLTNQHPLLHVLIVGIPMLIGGWLGDYNLGVALYSIIQMITMSAIFAFTLVYMKSKGIPMPFIIVSLIFFAFYPVNALFSITMWKDVIFALAVLLLTICIVELVINTEGFMKSKLKNAFLILSILSVMLLRHNGFYVGILLILFLFMINKRYYKRLLTIIGIVIVIILTYRITVSNIDKIQKGNPVETISICVQQIARTVKYNEDNLLIEEKLVIDKFFDVNRIGQLYEPYISDPVKGNFNSTYYTNNKGEFFSLWFKLLLKYPLEYIEAFVYNNYGYWYPETWNFIVIKGFSSPQHPTLVELNIHSTPIIQSSIIERLGDVIEKRNIPLISFAFSLGFSFWILVLCLGYNIYQRKVKNILIFMPAILVWFTILASPVFCEYRYIYSIFITLPILISTIYIGIKK